MSEYDPSFSYLHTELEALTHSQIDMLPTIRCPCCDSETMQTTRTEYNVDNFGSVLMNATTCQKCGYKHTDILSLERREPILVKARINSLADLDIKVIKSGTATITIPEFGATITPGPFSEGFITNVEGVLERMEDALTFMLSSAEGKRLKRGEKMRKQMRTSRESKPNFTLIIKDPFGNSGIVSADSSKIEKRRLTKRELERVKFGQYVLDTSGVSK